MGHPDKSDLFRRLHEVSMVVQQIEISFQREDIVISTIDELIEDLDISLTFLKSAYENKKHSNGNRDDYLLKQMDDLGRVMIPEKVRTALNWREDDKLKIENLGDCVRLTKGV